MVRRVGKVRWGHVRQVRHVRKVPGPSNGAFSRLPRKLQHLAAWRRMHTLPGGRAAHMPVRMYGTRVGVRPSSNLRLRGKASKIGYIQKRA